jgi:hypothetical protein
VPKKGYTDKHADEPDCPETGVELNRMKSHHENAPLRRVSYRESIAQIHAGFFP